MLVTQAPVSPETDGLVLVAVAVVKRAQQDAQKGNRTACAWLAQLKADIAEQRPDLAQRWGVAAD